MFDWSETGFFDAFIQLKNNTDKKIPAVPYTVKENQIDLQTARGHKGFSGILANDTLLIDTDDKKNAELLIKIVKSEELSGLVSDRDGGQGLH